MLLGSQRPFTSSQVLVHLDPTQEIVLSCDASAYGIGAVLAPQLAGGFKKAIGFAFWALSNAEKSIHKLKRKGYM